MNRGYVSALRCLSWRAWISPNISLTIFPVIPEISTYCVFWEMRCVWFLNLTITFGDLPPSLGFERGLCLILLSFKFTLNMFLFSAPLAYWGLLFGSLKVCCLECKFSRPVVMLQVLSGPLAKGVTSEGHGYLGRKVGSSYLLSTAPHCYQNTLPVC